MLAEVRVYRLLSKDIELNTLFDTLRGGKFDKTGQYIQGIFLDDIPDNFKKVESAPFMRINPIDENPAIYSDDENIAEEQTVQVDWWCTSASQSLQIKKLVDKILKNNEHIQYYSKRYKDPDINLKMNVRKYRVFDFDLEN